MSHRPPSRILIRQGATSLPCSLATPAALSGRVTIFLGDGYCHPHARNSYVTCRREMLLNRGAGHYYDSDCPEGWSLCDLRACSAFQRAQGWSGERASGIPNPATWQRLIDGRGRDILFPPHPTDRDEDTAVASRQPSTGNIPRGAGNISVSSPAIPGFPRFELFRPDLVNSWILMLRLRLIVTGWAADQRTVLLSDPTLRAASTWDEDLRQACARFQIAQGWHGTAASGYPDEETWRRLWSD
ncbi:MULTISPECIES: peptidoglycan-binding protein [Streptomyces]|uniref:Peptidoglycan-binding protein n=1 Tax=Streptomyces kasugaensis TaxID=1946 RepID=A0A4Q9HZE1_STRKA|nr:peptidoglycan-binding protein [Streptomyces kasugaensis]TBO60738.1 hypothetical protein EYS09_05020 [Streptomyces kasugaensis]